MKRIKTILFSVILLAAAAAFASAQAMMSQTFRASLTGASAGTPSRATGSAVFTLSADGSSLSYTLSVSNLDNVTMAHIHISSSPGKEGAVAVWLYPSAPPPQLKSGTFSGVLASGTITAADFTGPLQGKTMADLVNEIHAGDAYVNVHTSQYPAGEISGWIK